MKIIELWKLAYKEEPVGLCLLTGIAGVALYEHAVIFFLGIVITMIVGEMLNKEG